MDKRTLSAIPRPVLTDKNREMLLVPSVRYLVTADRQMINGTDTLIINFFRKDGGPKPAFRTFCQMDDYITQDLTTDKTKWKTGAINHITGYLYWYRDGGEIVVASAEERGVILGFLYEFKEKNNIRDYIRYRGAQNGAVVDSDLKNRIDEYQDTVKKWKLQVKHNKEKAEIDLQMEKFGGMPKDYLQFVRDKVFDSENYIFYGRAKARAYCTKCGHGFGIRNDADEIRHNKTVRCPFCNRALVCKSEGMGRGQLHAVKWSVLVQKHNEEVLVRYFCHTIDFCKDFHNPEMKCFEMFRTVHASEKALDFEWYNFKGTGEVRWCFFKDRGYGYARPSEMSIPRSAVLYNKNLLEDVSGTCMRYSAVDIYVDKVADKVMDNGNICTDKAVDNRPEFKEAWEVDWYFNKYRKAPYMEQLLKVGFYGLVKSIMEGHDCPGFVNGRTVMETLGLNRQQFNMLRTFKNPEIRDVMILRYAGTISQRDFEKLHYIRDDRYENIYEKYLDMRQYTTIYKLRKYFERQGIHDNDYFDYISWTDRMGYDMHSEFNLFPKDFKKAHDERSEEFVRFQDKKAKEDIKRFNILLKKLRQVTSDAEPMKLKMAGLFIRLPEKLEELKTEGEFLHHCVGTYRNRVAGGETMVFFIRRESEPEKPYYTLEWKGKVIQCRGLHNCDMTPEVRAFVETFQEKMTEYGSMQHKGKAGEKRCKKRGKQ